MAARKSKQLLWEIMICLEEAGEEDICSLLNQVMSAGDAYGSGADLSEYLEALTALESMGELLVREYQTEGAQLTYFGVLRGAASRPATAFNFDPVERCWRWIGTKRQMVEVPDE